MRPGPRIGSKGPKPRKVCATPVMATCCGRCDALGRMLVRPLQLLGDDAITDYGWPSEAPGLHVALQVSKAEV